MHLAIHAEKAAVRVDDRGRIPVDARRLAFEDRHDEDDLKLARERLHGVGGRTGNRLGQVEALAVLRLAEVGRVEELLEADDLRAAFGGVANQRPGTPQIGSWVVVGVILNDSDGERLEIAIGHTMIMRHDGPEPVRPELSVQRDPDGLTERQRAAFC